jgi:hypothetical protein
LSSVERICDLADPSGRFLLMYLLPKRLEWGFS